MIECQRQISEDTGFGSPEFTHEFNMPHWCQGIISERKVWSEGLFTLQIQVPEVEPFLPGQFLHLGVHLTGDDDFDGEPHVINRPYSVASPHGDSIEFFIVVVENGELTPRLWKLNPGDPILVSQKAAGSFTLLKAPVHENLWLFGTGTGLAPYVAMLRDGHVWEHYRRVFLVHGVRQLTDLGYTQELRNLEQQYPGRFRLCQTLSREQVPGYCYGRITDLFETGQLEARSGVEIREHNSTVLLCGNPAMLDSMEALLNERNMHVHRSKKPGNIVHERYW